MKDKNNPIPAEEKKIPRAEPELESDMYSAAQQKKIGKIIWDDYGVGIDSSKDWLSQKLKDLQHYDAEKPSIIEGLSKRKWMSDRNLGVAPATIDSYQATLLSTCWTPDTLHWIATEENDFNNRDNLAKFSKWAVSKSEGDVRPEIDDFIHNKTSMGFSVFKIFWKVWYEWVDKRIPVLDKDGDFKKYKTETVNERFEKGVIENIADIDDIVIPDFGKRLQDQAFLIEVLHQDSNIFKEKAKRKIYKNIPDGGVDKFIKSIKNARIEDSGQIRRKKEDQLGLKDANDSDPEVFSIDLLEWYGTYTIGKRTERYRFTYEPYTKTLLAGKPLRKINRTGKYPFVGGPLIRRPGKVRGKSLLKLIAPIVNAINNVFNQASDFQFVTNCPFGFHRVTDEGYAKQAYELEPGNSYPTGDGEPSKEVYFPNMQRSFVWEFQTINMLFETLERLTGAASYFMNNQKGKSGTATRDVIINEKSETRFGLWVTRIQEEICEAITMFINMYQDWAPPKLGERVLGKDGKKLFPNLSIKTLRGNYDSRMTPDVHMGSKTLERQSLTWVYENFKENVFMNPQVNPKGFYNLSSDMLKKMMGEIDVERYLGKEPPGQPGDIKDVEDEWSRFMQGDKFPPPEGATQQAMQHMLGHQKQLAEKLHELDEEYRPNFQAHVFETMMNVKKFMQEMQAEQMANDLAGQMVEGEDSGAQPLEV